MLTPVAWLAPHIPTLLVDSKRGHHTSMLTAYARASDMLRAAHPQAVVVVSARWQSTGPFLVDDGKRHATLTDAMGFGVEVRYDCNGDPALARRLVDGGVAAGLRVASAKRGVDSGVTVPMHFLVPDRSVPVVPLSMADRSDDECRAWGAALRRELAAWPEPVAFVVGGLLSYDEHEWRLGRGLDDAQIFDDDLIEAMRAGRWDETREIRRRLARGPNRMRPDELRAEGDLRHLEILRGFLGSDVRGDLLCYEASPGVGAALMAFETRDLVAKKEPQAN